MQELQSAWQLIQVIFLLNPEKADIFNSSVTHSTKFK